MITEKMMMMKQLDRPFDKREAFELWPQTIIEAVVIIVVGSSSTIPPYDHRSAWNPPSL